MRKTPLGLCSSVVAVLVWGGSCGGLAVVSQNQLFFFKHPIGLKILGLIVYAGIPTTLALALLGVGLAIGGLRQADRRKAPAVLGLGLSGPCPCGKVGKEARRQGARLGCAVACPRA